MNELKDLLSGKGTQSSIQKLECNQRYNAFNLRDAIIAFVMDSSSKYSTNPFDRRDAFPNLCRTCYLPTRLAIKKIQCESCGLVAYCSDSCKRNDTQHYESRLCKTFRKKKQISNTSLENYKRFRLKQLRDVVQFDPSQGGITQSEKNIVLYQRFCHYCGATSPSEILPCPRCDQAGFCKIGTCRDRAKDSHDRVCREWAVSTRCQQLVCRRFGQPLVWIPSELRRTFKCLPETWMEYFNLRNAPVFDSCARAMVTDTLSVPMSVLYAASKYLQPGLDKMSELVIHLVGSSAEEAAFPFKYEELLHFLPRLKRLELVLIGPESSDNVVLFQDNDLCESCCVQNRKITVRSVRIEYEKMRETKPHLIICCNSGVHYDSREIKYIEEEEEENSSLNASWDPALRLMLQLKIPLVFTSYNDWEIMQDLNCLKEYPRCEILMTPKLNPYRSLHSKMDPWRSHSSYTVNNYMFVCIGA